MIKSEYFKGFLLQAGVIVFLLSCGADKKGGVVCQRLDESIIDSARVLQREKMDIDYQFPVVRYFYVYQDSILIAVNEVSESTHLIELYNLLSKQWISGLFHIGRGENELLSGNVYLSGNMLLVNDYQKRRLATVNLDSLLTVPGYKPRITRPVGFGTTAMAPFKGRVIIENPYNFVDEKLGIYQEENRFLSEDDDFSYITREHEYNTVNVAANGRIIVNPRTNQVIYTGLGQSFFEVYDEQLRLKKRVIGPNILDVEYLIKTRSNKRKDVFFGSLWPYAYSNYFFDDDYVYLLYYGILITDEDMFESSNGYIIVTNWDGDFIRCYNLGGYALTVSKSSLQEDLFYACMLDDEGLPQLYRVYERR